MKSDLYPEHVAWCRQMFMMMADGGVWGIPASGLIFTRRGSALVLTDRLPWIPGCPFTPEELDVEQEETFQQTRLHFEAAGVEVVKAI